MGGCRLGDSAHEIQKYKIEGANRCVIVRLYFKDERSKELKTPSL